MADRDVLELGVLRLFTTASVLIVAAIGGCDQEPVTAVDRRQVQRSNDGTADVEQEKSPPTLDDEDILATLDRFVELLKSYDRPGADLEAQVTFRAMVKGLTVWSVHGSQALGVPVGIDLNWLLTVQLHSADAPISELPRGSTVRFLVSGPREVFGLDRPAGMTFMFTLTFRSGTDSISIVALRADPVAGDQAPAESQ